MGILTVIDRTIDADRPHAGRVTITITIIIFTPIATSPDVDISQTIAALVFLD